MPVHCQPSAVQGAVSGLCSAGCSQRGVQRRVKSAGCAVQDTNNVCRKPLPHYKEAFVKLTVGGFDQNTVQSDLFL